MGTEQSTPKPPLLHEETIRIINANVLQTAHLEKSASATTVLAYAAVAVIFITLAYVLYRAIIKFERMRTEDRLRRVVSLSSIVTQK